MLNQRKIRALRTTKNSVNHSVMNISDLALEQFKQFIWDFYRLNGRFFDWRHTDDPYKVVISEVMLQQTQTHRVAHKYPIFIQTFATFDALAAASLREVLMQWQGLGYNRRGKFLHQLAQVILHNNAGIVPDDPIMLEKLPGIGKATARSICAFAFNKPVAFIETNIRAVFIHHFFNNRRQCMIMNLCP